MTLTAVLTNCFILYELCRYSILKTQCLNVIYPGLVISYNLSSLKKYYLCINMMEYCLLSVEYNCRTIQQVGLSVILSIILKKKTNADQLDPNENNHIY